MQQDHRRAGRAVVPLLVALVMLALIFLSVRKWLSTSSEEDQLLIVSGTVEARYTRIASIPGGRITELHAVEGEWMNKGDLIASTDPLDLEPRLEQSNQAINEAQARLDLLLAGPRLEALEAAQHRAEAAWSAYENLKLGNRDSSIAASRNEADNILAQLGDARDELTRLELLFAGNVVEKRRVVAAESRVKALEASHAAALNRLSLLQEGPREEEIEQLRQSAEAARSEFDNLASGARPEEISAAESQLNGLFAARDVLQVNLEETSVYCPRTGEIVSVPVTVGDLLSPGETICELLLPDSIYIQTFIPEDRLAWISLGMGLEYSLDGRRQPGVATVSFISPQAEFTPRNLQTTQKRVEQVYRVKLQPVEAEALQPGIICDISIPAPEAGNAGSD